MQPETTELDIDLTDESVIAYLTGKPEFFVNNQDILARMRIPHDSGKAVSLIEKQVSVLRGKCGHLENSLRDLIAVARENENLHQRLHTLIQDIITVPSLPEIVALTQSSLRENFNAEHVHIMLIAPAPKRAAKAKTSTAGTKEGKKPARAAASKLEKIEGAMHVRHNDKRIRQFADVFKGGVTVCGMPSEEQLKAMIGKDYAHVASAAMIPLHFERKLGLVMLTSRDESRFGMRKGVMFLNQMGDLLSRRIHSYDAHAKAAGK